MEPMTMNIRVDDYQAKVSNSFSEFRGNEEFCDVTLASDDGDQIEAHKVILSASSSFFKNVFKKSNHSHPLLYLRGISRKDLLKVIDFVYLGETSIAQDDFKRFLKPLVPSFFSPVYEREQHVATNFETKWKDESLELSMVAWLHGCMVAWLRGLSFTKFCRMKSIKKNNQDN